MPNLRRRRGFMHERDLVLKLWKRGFAVLRAPASGSKTRRIIYPDLVAIKNGVIMVFEVKTTREKKPVYIPKHQVEKLREFLKRSGGYGFIAVKIVGDMGWRFIPLDELEETSGGNYKVSLEKLSSSLRISDLVAIASKNKTLMDYI